MFVRSLVFAQEQPFLFVKTNEDIGKRAITCIVNDSINQLWVGTYGGGLKKYNGVDVETFKHDVNISSGLSSSEIYDIHIGKDNAVWIATNNGLNLYNQQTDTFAHFNPKNEILPIHALAMLDDTHIILGTHQEGVYVFNTLTKEFQKAVLDIDENTLQVNALIIDQLKRIWVGTNLGIMQLSFKSLKLMKISDRVIKNEALLSNEILSLESDAFGNIWAGTVKNGVLKISTKEVNYIDVDHFPISTKRVFTIKKYSSGMMLCGTENDGLFVLTDKGEILNRYIKGSGDSFSIQSNSVWTIHSDINDRIWLGYYDQGVDKYDPYHFKFSFLQNDGTNDVNPFPSSVSSIAKDTLGRLWFSCIDKGVYVYNPENKSYTHLNDPNNEIATGLNNLDTPSLFIDSNQNVWVASWYNGIYLLKNGSKRFINISTKTFPKTLISNRIVSFSEDSKGIIWIGTFLGGLLSYDLKTNALKHFNGEAFQNAGLHNGNIRKVVVDKDDNVWLGTRRGIYRYNQKNNSVSAFNDEIKAASEGAISTFIVFSLYEDTNKNIWIGTDGYGLFSYSFNEEKFEWHGKGSELRNMTVNSITQSFDGLYWLGTDNGLIRYNKTNETFRIFESNDGLLSMKINRSAFLTENNTLYLGTSEGINFFDFNTINNNINVPKNFFQQLKIGNKRVSITEEGPLRKTIQFSDSLFLNHNQSSFSIDYIGVNQTRGEKNKYAYMLEGFDADWNYVNKLRTATYTNIKPGKYTFKLKASNNDGVWTENSKDIFIKVTPPWWLTIGAKISYVIIILALSFYISRLIRLRILERRKLELERNQREQTEELHLKKMQFFTNISHEFRTPLTLILNPLESLLSSPDEVTLPEEVRTKHRIIHRNTKRMKRLIDELMDFRKMQFGKIQLRVKKIDVASIVKNVISYYEEEALYRNINLQLIHPQHDEMFMWADASMIEKIIFNLISNAFKATKEGGAITVEIRHHKDSIILPLIDKDWPQGALEVIIKDSGIGIKKENIHSIFERFFQDKDNNDQYFGGTGIGLEVVRKFVDYHKGKIEVESEKDKGTTFKLFFALDNTHFEEIQFANYALTQNKITPPKQIEEISSHENEKNTPGSTSILVVEDNIELREYLKLELKGMYRIHEAHNGVLGFEMAKKHTPDLIIADVMMPEMDGIKMCEKLKSEKDTSNIPVIMLTAKVAEKERIEGIDAGADVYLKKPFSVNLLKSHIRQLIKSKNLFYNSYVKSFDMDLESIGHDNKILADVIRVIGNNLSKEDLCVQDIANELGLSRSKLYRKIKTLTGISANEIIRKTRLEKAKELLEKTDLTIGEICYRVGFASPSYFTKRFKEHTGIIPKEYRLNNKSQNEISTY